MQQQPCVCGTQLRMAISSTNIILLLFLVFHVELVERNTAHAFLNLMKIESLNGDEIVIYLFNSY